MGKTGLSGTFFNFSGADATGAGGHANGCAVDYRFYLLNIRLAYPAGFPVGVTYQIAGLRPFSTNFTFI
jgi:hypothetical protein